MTRKTARYGRFAFLLMIVMLVACSRNGDQDTASPSATSASETTSTEEATDTVDATSDASAESEESGESAGADDEEILVIPTLAPPPTPGPVNNLVARVVEGTAVEDITFLGLTTEDWINLAISVAIVLFGYLVAGRLVSVALRWLIRRTGIEVADVFLKKIENQLRWLVVVILASFATFRLSFLSEGAVRLSSALYFTLGLWIAVYIVWELISYAIQLYEDKITEDHGETAIESMLPVLKKTAHVILLMVGIIIWLDNFGVNVTALIAALGIAGFAVSLAAQDTIADAISGLVILLDQPFRVDDRIEIESIGAWGDVVEIGTRTTKMRARDNRMVIVPNSVISKNEIVNYTYPDPQYRIQLDIGIGYGTNIEEVSAIIIDAVRQIEGVLPDMPVDAIYNEMGDSAMIFRVRWWIASYTGKRKMYGLVNTALQNALDAAGVDMPFPTHTTNLEIGEETAERLSQSMSRSMTDRPGEDQENE